MPGDGGKRINIDFITKMPVSESGNDTIVTIVDFLTKRVQWNAGNEKGLTAKAFVDLFVEHYIRTRSLPAAIVSDRDILHQHLLEDYGLAENVNEIVEHLATVLRRAKQCLQEAQVEMVIEADKRRQLDPFKLQDSVFLNTRKLLLPMQTSIIITTTSMVSPRAESFSTSLLARLPSWTCAAMRRLNGLRPHRVDRNRLHPPPPALLVRQSGAKYEVEKLLSHQGRTVKTLQYHIK
ncbi:hypothetical protein FN846DRAFT_903517 [Sphaerosporella brunnea]|uniref:Integrase catalytic domain-containing protein n=1 Tax=Sphaerosporella brunnea TaxID=1250544 RepID=A0A5J5F6G6_9PEZI|nr:hypothetical protein FN846DRAFT_903517 [Sphaerosporella brunnea]